MDSSPVVGAISESKDLDRDEKLRLLRLGANHNDLDHREDALAQLLKLDPVDANARLVVELNRLPADVNKPYWLCPEARINRLVMGTGSPAVWEAFVRAAKRATVGLRMELLNSLDYTYIGDARQQERLASLAAFLDDETTRTIKRHGADDRFDGPCAAFTFPQISVRDFAAMQIGSILRYPDQPRMEWTHAQWSNYRKAVHGVLDKER